MYRRLVVFVSMEFSSFSEGDIKKLVVFLGCFLSPNKFINSIRFINKWNSPISEEIKEANSAIDDVMNHYSHSKM